MCCHPTNMLNAASNGACFKPKCDHYQRHQNPDRKGLKKACQDIRGPIAVPKRFPIPDPLRPQRGWQTSFKASELVQTYYIAITLVIFEELFCQRNPRSFLLNRHLINTMPSTTPWEGQLLDV